MHIAARRRPVAPVALAAALLAAFLVLIAPLSAAAHDSLVASSPEADSTVETLPEELTLTFSAKLIDGEGATEVVVTDADGASVTDGDATVDGAIVTQPLVDAAPAGEYHVIWKVVSSDGHPTSGEFSFTVASGTAGTPSATPTASPSSATEQAAPSPEASPTQAPEDSAGEGVWVWILVVVGILAVAAIVIWLVSRGRRGGPSSGSENSSAR